MIYTVICILICSSCSTSKQNSSSLSSANNSNDTFIPPSGEVVAYYIGGEVPYEPQEGLDKYWTVYEKTSWVDESAPEETTITFDGKKYTGKYAESHRTGFSHTITHLYNIEGELKPFNINIDANSGDIDFLSLNFSDEKEFSTDEFKILVERTAREYIDVNKYVKTENYNDSSYKITYKREVEINNVQIKSDFIMTYIPRLKHLNFVTDRYKEIDFNQNSIAIIEHLSNDNAIAKVKELTKSLCPEATDYKIQRQHLSILKNGDLGVCFEAVAETSKEIIFDDGTTGITNDGKLLYILVVLDKEKAQ